MCAAPATPPYWPVRPGFHGIKCDLQSSLRRAIEQRHAGGAEAQRGTQILLVADDASAMRTSPCVSRGRRCARC